MSHSVNPLEIAHFTKDSAHWWDEEGPFAILHRLNPVRMAYLIDQIGVVAGARILDVGCGGGLVCEPLARLGALVTGLDADENAIMAARDHAKAMGLEITYINESVEGHSGEYDVVLALEILEHVNDSAAFIQSCAARLKPGGVFIASTLNRTAKSFALGIVAAEYVLDFVPRGTHAWRKFIKPSELSAWMRAAGLSPCDLTGLKFDPLKGTFALTGSDVGVNYFMSAEK